MSTQVTYEQDPSRIGPPSLVLQAMEAWWPLEAAASAIGPSPLGMLPAASKEPVLVLPGFTAGDSATDFLRTQLRQHGFWVSSPRLGLNLGPTKYTIQGLRDRLDALAAEREQPVALVGISLGGVFARALARELPDLVSQVVTIGSPYRKRPRDSSTVEHLWQRVRHLHDGDMQPFEEAEEDRKALEVPSCSLYTRTDGVVSWQLCVDETGARASNPQAENIEVYATHTGMAHNASVVFAAADRLVRLRDGWRPFSPPVGLSAWYPNPVSGPPSRG